MSACYELLTREAKMPKAQLSKAPAVSYCEFQLDMLIIYNGKSKKKLSIRKVIWNNGKKTGAPPPDYETDG